jgi:hypothetical protein
MIANRNKPISSANRIYNEIGIYSEIRTLSDRNLNSDRKSSGRHLINGRRNNGNKSRTEVDKFRSMNAWNLRQERDGKSHPKDRIRNLPVSQSRAAGAGGKITLVPRRLIAAFFIY